jgi:hypothetical protein
MKKSIIYGAMGLMMGLGVSATAAPKPRHHNTDLSARAGISIIPLKDEPGFAVMVDRQMPSKSVVIIADQDENGIFKDVLTKDNRGEKKYNLKMLDAGNYSLEVVYKGHDVKTNFYVYNKPSGKVIFVQ